MPPASSKPLHAPSTQPAWNVAGKHVYLIGIGGSGMQGMARLLRARGAIVRGSDQSASATTRALIADGIGVDLDQSKQWLPDEADIVIASAAIKPDHPQMLEAQRRAGQVLTLNYAEALGRCMLGRAAVCVAGTHGKSTTTSMLSCVLADCKLEPTTIVGATCRQLGGANGTRGGGFVIGADKRATGEPGVLVAESCEFNRSFHHYHPTLAVITSVEADHLDIYGSLDHVVASFHHFAGLVAGEKDGGLLIIAHDGAHRREVTAGISAKVETIGFHPDADWRVEFDPATRGASVTNAARAVHAAWTMVMPGAHNAVNAATAAAFALVLGGDPAAISASLSAFRGVDRRSQLIGTWKGDDSWTDAQAVRVFDDYGHHPTEVATTLRALRQHEQPEASGGRLICIFQPHQHSRTRHLLDEFAAAFDAADIVIVPPIYFVRDSEEERTKVSAQDLVHRLRDRGVQAVHLHPFEAIVEHLQSICRPGDVAVVMGAGPVNEIGYSFLGTTR